MVVREAATSGKVVGTGVVVLVVLRRTFGLVLVLVAVAVVEDGGGLGVLLKLGEC